MYTVPALSSLQACKGELSTVIDHLMQAFPNDPKWYDPCNLDFFLPWQNMPTKVAFKNLSAIFQDRVYLKVIYANQELPLVYVDCQNKCQLL